MVNVIFHRLVWLVLVLGCSSAAAADFDSQIVPLLTKAGCNVAACHGAAAGRGGLHLSLWGLDPDADYEAIVRHHEGRRVNLANPADSLLLLKGTWQIDHGGEDALVRAPDAEKRILQWIRDGVPRGKQRRLADLKILPDGAVETVRGAEIAVQVTAAFDDGTVEDVTRWVVFEPNDATAVTIDDQRLTATVHRGGRHIVLIRFMNQVVPLVFTAPMTDLQLKYVPEQAASEIDRHVLRTLETLGLPTSVSADDRSFARRLYLDLTGALPLPEQLAAFANNASSHKRAALVDELLASDAFVDVWTYRLGKLLRIRSTGQDKIGAATFHGWVREQVREGTPYDQLVRTMLTAEGDTHEVGPANFYRVVSGARNQAEYASELLMGARMRCANCHNHPLDRWTQDDYHGLAALFARVEQGRVIRIGDRGAVTHPRTGKPARPRIPGERFVDQVADSRELLADWITAPENPYFAAATVNRLWRFLMGRGLLEPTDDVRGTNPPSHPELLDFLARDFVDHGYSLRHTIRLIATSEAYARSSETTAENAVDTMYYSHAIVRPLESEVLADAFTQVTGVAPQYGDHPIGTRAVTLFDPNSPAPSLDLLGRCSREQSCESATGAITLQQSLHMINGGLINDRILAPTSRLRRMLDAGRRDAEIVNAFYVRALSRPPRSAERQFWLQQMAGVAATEREEILADFVWSLLVCREFVTNH